jgi:DNA repair protein SbcD/Mre11
MKILHTADWHLGKYLDTFSRLDEQREVLAEICDIADQEAADVVIVAGDLFDTFNPSNEASELLFKTLFRLSNHGKRPVIAIAGNHDSPERIDMPNILAKECGILFLGSPNVEVAPLQTNLGISTHFVDKGFISLQIPHIDYPLRLIMTPYANEFRLKKFLGEAEREESLRQFLGQHWAELVKQYCDTKGVNILTTHLYMMNEKGEAPEEDEGEKSIMVGGAQAIFTQQIPEAIQYVALGHLHRFQNIGTDRQPVIYCGSPLAYSFAEANQTKFVSFIEATPNQSVKVRKIALTKGKKLLRNTFDTVDAAIVWLNENPLAFVELTMLTDEYLQAQEIRRLREAHQGIVSIIPLVKKDLEKSDIQYVNIAEQNMEDLFADYFRNKKGISPNPEIIDLFKEVLSLEQN